MSWMKKESIDFLESIRINHIRTFGFQFRTFSHSLSLCVSIFRLSLFVFFLWCYVPPRSNTIFENKFDFAPFGLLSVQFDKTSTDTHQTHTHTRSKRGYDCIRFLLASKHLSISFCSVKTLSIFGDCLLYLFQWPIIFICHSFTVLDSVWNIY